MPRNSIASSHIHFRFIEPTFYAGLLDDPLLLLRNRPAGTNLLVDCGQIHHLAKRVLKATGTIFISHAHMDHFMGLATFVRNILVSPGTVGIYGPPGLSLRLENLLSGFDWNLCENFWCSLKVHEIGADRMDVFVLPGPEGFRRRRSGTLPVSGDRVVYEDRQVRVRAAACDHKIPSLIFRIDEQPAFLIDEERLRQAGLVRGEWLREMNRRFNKHSLGAEPLQVLRRNGDRTEEVTVHNPDELYERIRSIREPSSIGYMTDVGFTDENRAIIASLFSGVSLLVSECTYNAEDRQKASASRHLCTSDLNILMDRLRPACVLPMHVSKSYNSDTARVLAELAPPPGTVLLRLPDHIAPKPLLPDEVPAPEIR